MKGVNPDKINRSSIKIIPLYTEYIFRYCWLVRTKMKKVNIHVLQAKWFCFHAGLPYISSNIYLDNSYFLQQTDWQHNITVSTNFKIYIKTLPLSFTKGEYIEIFTHIQHRHGNEQFTLFTESLIRENPYAFCEVIHAIQIKCLEPVSVLCT